MELYKKNNLIAGALICSLGFFFAAATGACSKEVSPAISVLVILFFQNAFSLLLNLPEIVKHRLPQLKTKRLGLHFIRASTGFTSFLCLFASLKSISLVDGMLLSYTEPLWIPFVALIWLKVKMKGYIWWGILIGFAGIVLILQPTGEGLSSGAILALLSGMLAAITLISIHRLAGTEPTYRTLFYNSVFGILVTLPSIILYFHLVSLKDLIYLSGVGLFTYLSQYLVTYSFRHANPTTLGPFCYTVVLFSGILGWIFWNEIPNTISFLGMILVIAGGVLSVYFEQKYQKNIGLKTVP